MKNKENKSVQPSQTNFDSSFRVYAHLPRAYTTLLLLLHTQEEKLVSPPTHLICLRVKCWHRPSSARSGRKKPEEALFVATSSAVLRYGAGTEKNSEALSAYYIDEYITNHHAGSYSSSISKAEKKKKNRKLLLVRMYIYEYNHSPAATRTDRWRFFFFFFLQ